QASSKSLPSNSGFMGVKAGYLRSCSSPFDPAINGNRAANRTNDRQSEHYFLDHAVSRPSQHVTAITKSEQPERCETSHACCSHHSHHPLSGILEGRSTHHNGGEGERGRCNRGDRECAGGAFLGFGFHAFQLTTGEVSFEALGTEGPDHEVHQE